MGIGNLCRMFHLFACSIFHAEGDIIEEGVVEEDGLLVHITNQLTQVVNTQVLHVDAIYQHLTFLHIVIARNQIHQSRFSAAALSHQGDGLTFLNNQIDVAQHPLVGIFERHVTELYLMFEAIDMLGVLGLLDIVLGQQNLIHTLHRSQSLGDVIAGLGELFQRIDDAIENDEVVDKGGSADGGIVQYLDTTEPEHDNNHYRS